MNAGFTEGPWIVHPVMAWVSPVADLEMPICQMRMATDGKTCEPEAIADANLIAAAPELFEALEQAAAVISIMFGCGPNCDLPETIKTPIGVDIKVGEIMADTRAALAKARGVPS